MEVIQKMEKQNNIQSAIQNISEIDGQIADLEAKRQALIKEHEGQIQAERERIEKQLSAKVEKRDKLDAEIKQLKEQLKALGVKSGTRESNHSTQTPLDELLSKDNKSALAMKALLAGKTRTEAASEAGVTVSTIAELIKKYTERNEIKEEGGKIIRA
jgi:septal ring factor EnvC (AmiA/AmiB activator)